MAGRNVSPKVGLLVATAVAVVFLGSALLKSRHIQELTSHVEWQPPGFVHERPELRLLELETQWANTGDLPDDVESRRLFTEGARAFADGNDRTALSKLSRAVARQPDWALARFYLGCARLATGNPRAAADDLERATEAGFEPADGPAIWWLALARLYAGEFEAAEVDLHELVDQGSERSAQAEAILARLDQMRNGS